MPFLSSLGAHIHKTSVPICCDFIRGKCFIVGRCALHHCLTPYHWQYQLPGGEDWLSFSSRDNDVIERFYCDVSVSCVPSTKLGQTEVVISR